ncbi:Imm49 family immunity protein [Archangium lansingense]|uniref:Imm49 family immunity protein n=1 Tax=Archangium lansingense TaxID=2995310 RepID=A0ABT4A9J5_9BACT|nr:Imm49 family immunity protein [Archangium lansinium]MCY1078314.1 Imm49 family immunity protein [Archangium lansinium]
MSNKFLPVYGSNARYRNQQQLPQLLQGGGSPGEVLEFCGNQRLLGVVALLLLGDTETFQSRLYRSGRAFLALALQVGVTPPVALSRSAPFLDALAARDVQGAREIATLATRVRQANLEYEEDFLYFCFLMEHCLLGQPEAEARASLDRFEAVLEGSEEPRLDVARALLARDERGFEDALRSMVSARARKYAGLRERGSLSQERWATDAKVCVEGLALLVLAELAGMKTPPAGLPGLPPVARCRQPPSEPPDTWKQGD